MVDETGYVKKGTDTVGAQRQYTGTAGRIENAQVSVRLVHAGRRGHAAVDRELYVPRSWTSDPDRCRAAGLGDKDLAFGAAGHRPYRERRPSGASPRPWWYRPSTGSRSRSAYRSGNGRLGAAGLSCRP